MQYRNCYNQGYKHEGVNEQAAYCMSNSVTVAKNIPIALKNYVEKSISQEKCVSKASLWPH